MSEIEKCVCGGGLECVNPEVSAYPSAKRTYCVMCYSNCWRRGPEKDTKEAAIAAWNHDMRGLRLLRELVAIRDRALLSGMIYTGKESRELVDLMQRADAWAEEGDRELDL